MCSAMTYQDCVAESATASRTLVKVSARCAAGHHAGRSRDVSDLVRQADPLVADIRSLIDAARQRAAAAVNAELTMLYWHVGRRVRIEMLQGQRAEYGKQVVSTVAASLTREYGKG